MPDLNWDDLRFLLALDRAGSFLGAARALRVAHSTVARRLEAAEQALQTRLFHRRGTALVRTEAAMAILAHATRVEQEIASLSRAAFGTEARLDGTVRLAAPLAFIAHFLLPRLRPFQERYPNIEVALSGDLPLEAMLRGEADIGLRISRPVSEQLDIRRLCPCRFALYEAAEPGLRRPEPNLYLEVAYDQQVLPETRWVRTLFPATRPALQLSTTVAVQAAVKAGLGVGALPCYLGDNMAGIRRVLDAPEGPLESLYLVTHREQRGLARVRVLVDFLAETVANARRLFEGADEVIAAASETGRHERIWRGRDDRRLADEPCEGACQHIAEI